MTLRNSKFRFAALGLLLVLSGGTSAVADSPSDHETIRIMSWNVSDNDFVTHPEIFQAIVRMAMADVLLFDEVSPSANTDLLRTVLDDEDTGSSGGWHINFGQSGVIACRI